MQPDNQPAGHPPRDPRPGHQAHEARPPRSFPPAFPEHSAADGGHPPAVAPDRQSPGPAFLDTISEPTGLPDANRYRGERATYRGVTYYWSDQLGYVTIPDWEPGE